MGVLAVIVVVAFFAPMLLGGLLLMASDGAGGLIGGGFLALIGAGGLAVLVLERRRYRSDPAERVSAGPRSPGGEGRDEQLEPRFRATDEVFLDPTSGRRMRVYLDGSTGERRYRAEG